MCFTSHLKSDSQYLAKTKMPTFGDRKTQRDLDKLFHLRFGNEICDRMRPLYFEFCRRRWRNFNLKFFLEDHDHCVLIFQ
jgi:hypothetical protein